MSEVVDESMKSLSPNSMSEGYIATLAKLLYLLDTGDPTAYSESRSKDHSKSRAKEVWSALKQSYSESSVEPLILLLQKRTKEHESKSYSKEISAGMKWKEKSDLITFVESHKYLHVPLSSTVLDKYKEIINYCGMDDIDQKSSVFLHNENLVMLEICDMLTTKQVFLFSKHISYRCGTDFGISVNEEDKAVLLNKGMKEVLFLCSVRFLEISGKINRLYYDAMTKILGEMIKRCETDEEKDILRNAIEILHQYNVKTTPPGYCLVLVVKRDRQGVENEIKMISRVFGDSLGYHMEIVEDPTIEDIEAQQVKIKAPQVAVYDSFVCWILSHGTADEIILAENGKIKRDDLLKIFSCESVFSKKPKLFFIAACQGNKHIPVRGESLVSETDSSSIGMDIVKTLQITDNMIDINTVYGQSDRIVAYATVPDHVSFRSPDCGSVFVNKICEVITMYPGSNITKILEDTTRSLHQIMFTADNFQGMGKQACYYESTLQKRFYFPLPRKNDNKYEYSSGNDHIMPNVVATYSWNISD